MSSLRAFALLLFAFLVLPSAAAAQGRTGGAEFAPPAPDPAQVDMAVPGGKAKLLPDGTAAAAGREHE